MGLLQRGLQGEVEQGPAGHSDDGVDKGDGELERQGLPDGYRRGEAFDVDAGDDVLCHVQHTVGQRAAEARQPARPEAWEALNSVGGERTKSDFPENIVCILTIHLVG